MDFRKPWDEESDVDVFLATYDLRDGNARYIIPLHLHEVGHDRSFLERVSYMNYLDRSEEIQEELDRVGRSLKIVLMMWGEHLLVSK